MLLLIGATGTVGKELVKELAGRGLAFRVLTRDPKKAEAIKRPGMEIVKGDLSKPDTLKKALSGVERVFLLSSADPRQVELEGNLIRAAKTAGIKFLVKLSAFNAGLAPAVRLLRWHGQVEDALRASDLPYAILRPHFFLQNLFGFVPTIVGQGAIYAPLKDGKIAAVDVRDIARVAADVLTGEIKSGRVYELTGPESLSFTEVADKISRALGKTVKYLDVPPAEARKGMIGAGMPDWFADALLELYAYFSAGHGDRVTDTVKAVTGKPARGLDDLLRDYREVFAGKVPAAA